MHSIVTPLKTVSRSRTAARVATHAFRKPNYDCREQADMLKLVIYVPGVEASGVEIEWRGADLTVTARKAHFVRVNWQALHLESAQRDYQLRLRLGHGFAIDGLRAEIAHGILTITVPKLAGATADERLRVA